MKNYNFYGNALVTQIENHYAYGNEKSWMFSSYYDTLHDNITKRFFLKKTPYYHKKKLHGKKWRLRKKSGLRNIFKKWVAYAKMKKRNKTIFFIFLKLFFCMDEIFFWF